MLIPRDSSKLKTRVAVCNFVFRSHQDQSQQLMTKLATGTSNKTGSLPADSVPHWPLVGRGELYAIAVVSNCIGQHQ